MRKGIPVKPMLAKPSKGIKIILSRFEDLKFTCEYKYDGFRGQLHFWRNEEGKPIVKIFSRNLEDMSESYPDITAFVSEHTPDTINNFIIDSEIVPFDRNTGKIMPF